METWVGNALAAGMLPARCSIVVEPASAGEVRSALAAGAESCVGHAATAAAFTTLLGSAVAERRIAVTLGTGDVLYIGALVRPGMDGEDVPARLPAGAVLDAAAFADGGYEFRWRRVECRPADEAVNARARTRAWKHAARSALAAAEEETAALGMPPSAALRAARAAVKAAERG